MNIRSIPTIPLNELSAIAGSALPDTPLVQRAIELAAEASEPWLFNHSMRSWLFSTHLAAAQARRYDPEVLAVASVLHDLGLTAAHGGPNRFEVEGADAACAFLDAAAPQIDPGRRQLVWDAIALHATSSIARHKEPEVALVNAGIIVDYAGAGREVIAAASVDAILERFPRRRMKAAFTGCLCALARERPASTYGTWVADFGRRYIPGYEPPSSVDSLLDAPWPE